MSWKISESGDITMTRGDTPQFRIGINIKDTDGTVHPYEPVDGDEIIFALSNGAGTPKAILTKIIPNDTKILKFEEIDTKPLNFGTYIYEISLNSEDYHCTFIEGKKLKLTTEIS